MQAPHHVLILGCGRSGTSIFGELFEALPEYTYFSEPDYALLTQLDYTRPIAVKVPRESAGFPPTEGLSFPLHDWLQRVPDPKTIFWQVRHPLDTICSLRVGISRNWGHHPQPPDWQDWLERPLLERCAHHWLYINTVGYEQLREIAIINRYEDMIADPASVWPNAPQPWVDRVQNTHNAQYIEAKTSSAYSTLDHSVKVGRWRENLSMAEAEALWAMVGKTARTFGYDMEGVNQ